MSVVELPFKSTTRILLLSKSATYTRPSGPKATLTGLLNRFFWRSPSTEPAFFQPASVLTPCSETGGRSPPGSPGPTVSSPPPELSVQPTSDARERESRRFVRDMRQVRAIPLPVESGRETT